MFTVLFSVAVILSTSAHALVIEEVSQRTTAENPFSANSREVTRTIVKFSVHSCKEVSSTDYQIEINQTPVGLSGDLETVLSVVPVGIESDCQGATQKQVLRLETDEIKADSKITLLNPVAVQLEAKGKRPAPVLIMK